MPILCSMYPLRKLESVKIIAVTESECISETLDGFSTNISVCDSEPDELVLAVVDQKAKQRAIVMNLN